MPLELVDAPSGEMFFEDFRVGQRYRSQKRTVTDADIARFVEVSGDAAAIHVDGDYARSLGFDGPLAHGPLGLAIVFGLLFELGTVRSTAIAMLDLDWQFSAPIFAGDEVEFEMTITRCRRTRSKPAGVVHRYFELFNGAGRSVQSGTSAMMVRARDQLDGDAQLCADFGSVAWGKLLVERLAASSEFAEAMSTFDGAVGLEAGRESLQLRIYKGQVLECARSTPRGATFTVSGSELAWVNLAAAPRNAFIARTMAGDFSVTGDVYEYLRLTKALVALWDCIRELAAEGMAR
jgi:acyl dehydratase